MYLTLTNNIKHLCKKDYEMLREMCKYSNNLYNVALYNIRQYYFNEKKFLTYESNYHECKTNENYKMLQAGVSQQILKVADRSFKSFFNLIKKAKHDEYRFMDIKMPHYKPKGGLFALVLSTNAIAVRNGYFVVPVSREFEKTYGKTDIHIPFPEKLKDKKMKEVRILPYSRGKHFKIQYCYEETENPLSLNKDNALAIDLGINNLATCITNTGTSFIIDGKKLKSINRYWNKRKARLQSVASKQNIHITKQIEALTVKRNNRANDYLKKTARYIVSYCIENDIGTLVCGYNKGFKKSNIPSKAANQHFVQISFGELRNALSNLCERYGITYLEQEESYTSKASFLDKDEIPVFTHEDTENHIFSGTRIKRGLYRTGAGINVNADVNAAANILRKSNVVSLEALYSRGVLGTPVRIRVS